MEKRKRTERPRRHSFLQGALILTAGMAVVKVIGALFKVPLKYAVGEYGMGLFNVAYNFYGPVFSLATAGLPIAVSRMVSEKASLGQWRDVRQIKRVAMPMFLAFGVLGAILLFFTAPLYCRSVISTENAIAPMLALAPAVLFACLGSVYRGYYEGLRDMTPTAMSEIVEAGVKLVIGLGAAYWIVERCTEEFGLSGTVFGLAPSTSDEATFLTLSFAAAGAIFGVTCGSVFSLLYLSLRHRFRGDGITPSQYRNAPPPAARKATAKKLLAITVPIAVGSVTMNIAGLIDATFLQSRIAKIMQEAPQRLLHQYQGMIPAMYLENPGAIPTFLYGCYTLALTIYLLVPAVTQAFGISALPNVTESWTRGNKKEIKRSMESVVRITALFCFPAGLGISALSEPITRLLYGNDASTPIISGALFLLGFASLAAALSTPLSSMLQAVGRVDLPVKLLLAAMGIKIAVNYVLCGIPEFNITGAGIGTLCCYLFLVISQLLCLKRVTGVQIDLKGAFLKPLAAAALCGGTAMAACRAVELFSLSARASAALGAGAGILCGACIYVISLLLLGGIEKNDIAMLPNGQKIAKTLEKRGWI